MKIIIGVVGENGGGKDSFVNFLKECLGDKTLTQIRSSDILAETFRIWGIDSTRPHLQKLAIAMNETFGEGTLTKAVHSRIQSSEADVVIFGGVRWLSDVEMIRSFPKNLLVYIDAHSKVRFERVVSRNEKVGESDLTYDKFLTEQQAKTELEIPQIAAMADVKIDNNGTLADLKKQVEDFCCRHLEKLW